MARFGNRFATKREAQGKAKRVWLCGSCLKWHEKRTITCDVCKIKNLYFPSTKEARRYLVLIWRQKLGLIKCLEAHPKYPIVVNDEKIVGIEYDSRYFRVSENGDEELVIEDVKATRNPKGLDEIWKLKRKLFEACYKPLTVTIVTKEDAP